VGRPQVSPSVRRIDRDSMKEVWSAARAVIYFLPPVVCLLWALPILPMAFLPGSDGPPPLAVWPIAVAWALGLCAIPGYVSAYANRAVTDPAEERRSLPLVASVVGGVLASATALFYFAYFFGPMMALPALCLLCCLSLLRHVIPRARSRGG
jgi:hypothetical protein